MKVRSVVAASLGGLALVAAGSSSAFAGEVNGNQQPIPAPLHAHSICVFSGQNSFLEPTEPGRVQSYGQIVAAGGKSMVPSPGVACNGHTGGYVPGGGGE